MYGSAHVLVGLRFLVFICHKSILAWQTDEQTAGRQRGPQQSLRAMATVPPTAAAAAGPIAAAAPSTTAAASPGAAGANKRAAIDISGDDDSIPSPSPAPKAAKTAGAKTVEPTSVVPYYYYCVRTDHHGAWQGWVGAADNYEAAAQHLADYGNKLAPLTLVDGHDFVAAAVVQHRALRPACNASGTDPSSVAG